MRFRSEDEKALNDRPMSDKVIGSGQLIAAWALAIAMLLGIIVGPTIHAIVSKPLVIVLPTNLAESNAHNAEITDISY